MDQSEKKISVLKKIRDNAIRDIIKANYLTSKKLGVLYHSTKFLLQNIQFLGLLFTIKVIPKAYPISYFPRTQ